MVRTIIVAIALMSVVACSAANTRNDASPTPAATRYSALTNGRNIFQTGRDVDGVQIVAQPPALRESCAACHGVNGAGGKTIAPGAVSADLRHVALVVKQSHPYTLATLQRAVSTGIDNEGETLNRVMPRWKLSKRDLHDVAQYVLTQLK